MIDVFEMEVIVAFELSNVTYVGKLNNVFCIGLRFVPVIVIVEPLEAVEGEMEEMDGLEIRVVLVNVDSLERLVVTTEV
jgi:hypothetical protein